MQESIIRLQIGAVRLLDAARRQTMFALLIFLSLAAIMAVQGCAQLGLPTPQTLNEKIATAKGSVTQIRASATQLLDLKKISSADAENVLQQTDTAKKGVDLAQSMTASDPKGADFKLQAAVAILTAVQAYLATKGP